jgi:hypothetical protein
MLADRENLDELRTRADADDLSARQLAEVLTYRGTPDQALQILRVRTDAGNGDTRLMAMLLARLGYRGEAERLRQCGLDPDGSIGSR